MGLKIPADGDFSVWKKDLDKKISGCGNTFRVDDLQVGKGMFSWLENSGAAETLGNYMDNSDSTKLSSYTNKRWWMIFIMVLGIVLLIASIVLAWFARKRRKVFSSDKPVAAERALIPAARQRMFLRFVSWLLFLVAFTSCVLVLVGSSQMIKGVKKVECNGWLAVHAHYFGADGLKSASNLEAPVASDWRGTIAIRDELLALEPKTVPSEENPVRQKLVAVKEDAAKNLYNIHWTFRTITAAARDLLAQHKTLVPLFLRDLGYSGPNLFNAGHPSQMSIYEAVVTDYGVVAGATKFNALFEKYISTDAYLLNNAYSAVQEGLLTITEIDESIGEFARHWDSITKSVRDLIYSVAAFSIIVSVLAMAFTVWAQLNTVKLSAAIKRNVYPGELLERRWRQIVVGGLVGSGLVMTFFGLNLGVATVGSDVCQVIEKDLLTEGRWEIFPDQVLRPRGEKTTVEMPAVLEACVKRGGEGSVAVSIGLDGRIAEIGTLVDGAKKDLEEGLVPLIARETRMMGAKQLRSMMRKGLDGATVPARSPIFYQTFWEVARPHWYADDTPEGGVHELEFSFGYTTEEEDLLALLPLMTVLPANGALTQTVGTDVVYEWINAFATAFHEHRKYDDDDEPIPPENRFPHQFCSNRAVELGVDCEVPPEPEVLMDDGRRIVDLSRLEKVGDADALGKLVSDLEGFEFRGYTNKFRARVTELLRNAWVYDRAWVTKSTAEVIKTDCPSKTAECSYREFLERDRPILREIADKIPFLVDQMCSIYEGLIDQAVVPVLDTLLDEANGITENANCQVIGTALDQGVRPALCQNIFPGTAFNAAFFFTMLLAFLIGSHQAWTWSTLMSHVDMPGSPPETVLEPLGAVSGEAPQAPQSVAETQPATPIKEDAQ